MVCVTARFTLCTANLEAILNWEKLFELTIMDWPDLLWRGVHIDAKGERPGYGKLVQTIREWSHYKVNMVLFEYEDSFPYSQQQEIVSSNAYSQLEIQELQKLAGNHFVTIVPLVQCIGHVEYILKHSNFAALREKMGRSPSFVPAVMKCSI